ncbi:MAG: hypothetical protein Q8O87_00370 [bacterium]|nr:hypothetical protein [bacterium]
MSEINLADLRKQLRRLPKPLSQWQCGDVDIKIYRPRNLLGHDWYNEALFNILLHARNSYDVYGDRPLLDDHDYKSAIYLARVRYPFIVDGRELPCEEWLSFRLVPGIGEPLGSNELNKFFYRGRRVDELVRERLFDGQDYLSFVVASSRMCGIHPYLVYAKKHQRFSDRLSKAHKYTAFCYALVSHHFWEDYLRDNGCRFVTGIILNRFVDKALTVKIDGQGFGTAFTPAAEVLGIDSQEEIYLDREDAGNYVYQFPAYWLNVRQLVSVLQRLIDRKLISNESLREYLGINCSFRELIDSPDFTALGSLKDMGKLLTVSGDIGHSRITGEQLRLILDFAVSDGPELKITPLATLKDSVAEFIEATHTVRIS